MFTSHILFDQPQVVTEAPEHPRMERVGGDFFAEVPTGADAYLLRWIVHDWDDDEAIALLESVPNAAKPGSRVLLVESVIPETAEFDMGKWMDVNMLVMANGRERTAIEFGELYDRAGCELEQIIPTPSPLSIIIGKPRA